MVPLLPSSVVFVFIDSAAVHRICGAVRNSFQLVFGRRLAAGDILCVPCGLVRPPAVDWVIFIIGRNNAVGTIHIDIAGIDPYRYCRRYGDEPR